MKKELPFRIEKKEAFQVIGYSCLTTNRKGEGKKAIPKHWASFQEQQTVKLLSLSEGEPEGLLGVNIYNIDEEDPRIFEYLIAVVSNKRDIEGLHSYSVPAKTWAIFPCTKETIGKTEAQAITKWLPKSGYRPLNKGYITGKMKSGAPDIEYYGNDGNVEVWVAVEEK